MILVIDHQGTIRMIYQEDVITTNLGNGVINRVSHVEPDEKTHWWADLSLIKGPKLGPFDGRAEAVKAEIEWIAMALSTELLLL